MMRVTELFAGIGAQRMALTLEGIPHTIAGISEIDRHALASYGAIYGDCPNLGDITKIDRLPPCDLVTYSFPCQDLSLAGKRAGMGEGTRSGLVWEVTRLLERERERPEWLLMENVPQVLTSPLWPDLTGRLEAMGYRNRWAKLDSSRFGSAQKRVRAFMVSRMGQDPPDLPSSAPNAPRLCLRDIMEPERAERYVKRIPMDRVRFRGESPKAQIKVVADWERKGMDQANRLYSSSYSSPAIMCHGGGKRDVKVVCSEDGSDLVVSILTPRECWRLMGFPDWAYDRAAAVSSETQLYNQAGNSIVVEVLRAIFRAMEQPGAVQTSLDAWEGGEHERGPKLIAWAGGSLRPAGYGRRRPGRKGAPKTDRGSDSGNARANANALRNTIRRTREGRGKVTPHRLAEMIAEARAELRAGDAEAAERMLDEMMDAIVDMWGTE